MVHQFPVDTLSSDAKNLGNLPIYLQIAEQVSREISAGLLVDGERLPTEREMAQRYGVAVRTLRKALARLTEMGLLIRRQGSGNYVQKNKIATRSIHFSGLSCPAVVAFPRRVSFRSRRLENQMICHLSALLILDTVFAGFDIWMMCLRHWRKSGLMDLWSGKSTLPQFPSRCISFTVISLVCGLSVPRTG